MSAAPRPLAHSLLAMAVAVGCVLAAGLGPAISATATAVEPTPSAVSAPVDSSAVARGRLVVHGVGDVSLDPSYVPALRARGYDHAWSGLDGLFLGDDLTIVNLECPVSDRGAAVVKEFTFRCDPAALPAARSAGVEVANLANNHVRDFGPEAMLD